MPNLEYPLTLGAHLAGVAHGVDPSDFVKMGAYQDRLQTAEAEPYGRALCRAALSAYEAIGKRTVGYHFFKNASVRTSWCDSIQACVTKVVHDAFAEESIKSASGIGDFIASALGGGAKAAPAALKYLYLLSSLGGAGAGVAAWSAGRDATQDGKEVEADRAKADRLNQMTRMMDRNLQNYPA